MKRLFAALLVAGWSIITYAQAPQVPESFMFAGEKVYFDRPDKYERMDRELLSFAYMHSNSTLMLKRSPRIFHVVEPILKEYGLPDDLKYVMAIESNLDPNAHSRAGAAGLWQLMSSTAKEMGLEVNANVDERYHTEKATIAACKYLKQLYEKYGNWFNVMAAYNGGPSAVSSRLEKQSQDCAIDLWMVEETSRYMFRAMTAKMFFEDPVSFGFDIPESQRYQYEAPLQVVEVSEPVEDLVAFASKYSVSYLQLKRNNLWLRESKLNNSSHKLYQILIPVR